MPDIKIHIKPEIQPTATSKEDWLNIEKQAKNLFKQDKTIPLDEEEFIALFYVYTVKEYLTSSDHKVITIPETLKTDDFVDYEWRSWSTTTYISYHCTAKGKELVRTLQSRSKMNVAEHIEEWKWNWAWRKMLKNVFFSLIGIFF